MKYQSEYVAMRDHVLIALSVWLPLENYQVHKYPAILTTTRYWRAKAFKQDNPEYQFYHPYASYFWNRGYGFVVADARGTGASFGTREGEITAAEVEDISELIDWVAAQPWCDGRVVCNGTSYTANTSIHSLATPSPALKGAVVRAPDFDLARHLMVPGGMRNQWFIDTWGELTAALDQHDLPTLIADMRESGDPQADNMLGVRPVDNDKDGLLLKAALAEHRDNFNVTQSIVAAQDDASFGSNPYEYQKQIEQNNHPLVVRCGWHDAATALGALSLFCTFNSKVRVVLGPWSHNGAFRIDPFAAGQGKHNEPIPQEEEFAFIADTFDRLLNLSDNEKSHQAKANNFARVDYYTLGENRWKSTTEWRLAHTNRQRLYLSANHSLSTDAPTGDKGCDRYQVDPTTSSGINNRWGCQMKLPVFFDDRREEDQKRLVYDTEPLTEDREITGHPVVKLFVRSTATDGQFFVYLETIDPDGRVRWLTDGQLRALHRKVSDEAPPFKMFGPYHSFKQKDAAPLIPGEVAEITFDLLPISVLLKRGQRIRLAIAGADADVFDPIKGCESPELIFERNRVYASYIDLPFV